jgi:hypothetical protein
LPQAIPDLVKVVTDTLELGPQLSDTVDQVLDHTLATTGDLVSGLGQQVSDLLSPAGVGGPALTLVDGVLDGLHGSSGVLAFESANALVPALEIETPSGFTSFGIALELGGSNALSLSADEANVLDLHFTTDPIGLIAANDGDDPVHAGLRSATDSIV